MAECSQAGSWGRLQARFSGGARAFDLNQAFATEVGRFEHFSQQAPHVFADLSKNLWDRETEAMLMDLARERGVEARRDAMFAGERINRTEDRAVLHTLLRTPSLNQGAVVQELAVAHGQVMASLADMLAFADQVRADGRITDVVNIGIGGSDLGPQMAVLALDHFVAPSLRFHFVSNVDGHELAKVLNGLQPSSTLFLVASKTFTTAETMLNARSARHWFLSGGRGKVSDHFVGLTTNTRAASEFGIDTCFGFWDWVGGRYSMWSSIGLSIALAIGGKGFRDLLAGAFAMDEHFRCAPLERNLPVRLALLDIWYRNFHGFTSRCIAPYHSGLRRFPAYLQQLEMESNGKRVDMNGNALPFATSAVVWGEPGTNGQHAFFQMLHQGTDPVPVEFVTVRHAEHGLPDHHGKLLAHAMAQSRALMAGKADAGGHRHFPGNRPSTFMILDRLDAASLGALVALHEHRVFVAGAVWGLNSFDQWGVELGKVLALDLEARLPNADTQGLDASTAGLLLRLAGRQGA